MYPNYVYWNDNAMIENKKSIVILCIGVFVLMFILNWFTPYLVDDFRYHYSFLDYSRIETLGDIAKSMMAHANTCNGRTVAHALVQLSMLFPKWVFDMVNSLVFTTMIFLIARICNIGGKSCSFILLFIMAFCSVWLYVRDFGQVFLWQDGAINYLWGMVLNLIFVIPFVNDCIYGKSINSVGEKLLFALVAFFSGAYLESVSLASILIAVLLLEWKRYSRKRADDGWMVGAVIVACLGYLTIYMAPAQWVNKGNTIDLPNIMHSVAAITTQYRNYAPLLIAFAGLETLMVMEKVDKNIIVLSIIFFIGSLVAMYILIFAKFFVARAALGASIFLIIADGVCICALFEKETYKRLIICISSVLVLMVLPTVIEGGVDIIQTCSEIKHNEEYIISCAEKGIMHVEVPCISQPATQYSAAYGLKYLDTSDATSYPNDAMSVYYGVETIVGK